METKILSASEGTETAAQIIRSGGVAAFPTETVYGLGANAFDPLAVKKIFEIKGRPGDNPLIVHIADLEDVTALATDIPDVFYLLAEKFMPGPLTVVLKKSRAVPYEVTAGGETVGIRMPAHPVARAFIRACGTPVAAPSANVSAHVSPTSAAHVFGDLNGKISVILDGGDCEVGIESTVLDLTQNVPAILRPGSVTAEALSEILPGVTGAYDKKNAETEGITRSPGTKYRHYSPRVPAILAGSAEAAVALYDEKTAAGVNAVLILKEAAAEKVGGRRCFSMGRDNAEAAKNIYKLLRAAEDAADFIIIETVEGSGVGEAVLNRLKKAAAEQENQTEARMETAGESKKAYRTEAEENNAEKNRMATTEILPDGGKTASRFRPKLAVAFVCTGNTCRSVMAEAVLRDELTRRGVTETEIISAGTNALPFSVTSSHAIKELSNLGVSLTEKESVALNLTVLHRADVIIAVTSRIKDKILRMFAVSAHSFERKLFSYAEITGGSDLTDPFGLPFLYRTLAERLVSDGKAVADFIIDFLEIR
ncbi:MAG: threonylcarbamoyl-AMP synthase [Clostridiaceae bacterium]|jgi:L-threonylcarbamoyladenylate synthase|nr:threonylcarbamoyl-AMP synthase [Clostridiaceae bacterium]